MHYLHFEKGYFQNFFRYFPLKMRVVFFQKHVLFVCLGYDAVLWLHLPAALCVPVSALIILVCSWIVVAAVRRLLGRRAVYLLG